MGPFIIAMKIYIIINSNCEGNNFIGCFDSLEKAKEANTRYLQDKEKKEREMWEDAPSDQYTKEDIENTINTMLEWDKTHIREVELNTISIGDQVDVY